MRPILISSIFFVLTFFISSKRMYSQNETRKFSLVLVNEKKEPIAEADVQLIDNNGKGLTGKTNKEGLVSFDIGPTENYTNARAIIKKGANRFDLPVFINYRLKQLTIEVPDDMVILVDDLKDWNKDDQKEPTVNTEVSTDKSIYLRADFSLAKPEFGPFTPACDVNPLATVPTYDNRAVESEKTLLDAISESCIGAAGDAVNSLVDLTYSIVAIKTKMTAIWQEEIAKGKATTAYKSTEKLAAEEGAATSAAIADAIEKVTALYEGMKKIAAGPELYVVSCVWDGIKKFFVPEGILKMKKATESYGDAKDAMGKKLDALKARYAMPERLSMKDKDLLTNWDDIKENVENTSKGLNILVSYASNPRKLFTSYESQAENSLNFVETAIKTITTDCKIIELDKKLMEGIEAAKAALTSKRKFAAQMAKEEGKCKDRINAISGTKPWYQAADADRIIPANTMAPLIGIESQWVQYVPYHNERVNADKDVKRIDNLLSKLSNLCRQIQPIAISLNQMVADYEQLYVSGCEAADKCDFSNAYIIVSKLRQLERTACGHFYPKPFGFIKSDNLDKRITRNKEHCKTGVTDELPTDPSWVSTVLYKVFPECANTNDPRNTIEDVKVMMYFDGKRINATGGSTMFPAGTHTLRIEVEPREGYPTVNSKFLIKRIEWIRCAAGVYREERPLASETPNSKEVTMKVNIVKNDDKNHCYKAVIYIDKCIEEP